MFTFCIIFHLFTFHFTKKQIFFVQICYLAAEKQETEATAFSIPIYIRACARGHSGHVWEHPIVVNLSTICLVLSIPIKARVYSRMRYISLLCNLECTSDETEVHSKLN